MTTRIWPALLLAFVVFAVVPATAQADPIVKGLDYLHARQVSSGGFGTGSIADPQITPWAIMAISAAAESPQTSRWNKSGKDPIEYLQGLDLEAASGNAATQVNRASFYAKVILAYVAAGRADLIGSAGSKSINLVAKLRSFQDTTTGFFAPWDSYATVSTTVWAVLALKAANQTDANLDAAMTWLIGEQNTDGGWGGDPASPSDVDDTAAAIMALRAKIGGVDGMASSNPVIQDALAFLRDQQHADAGFPSRQTDSSSYAESTAWVVQAIVRCGQSPSSWNKGSATPITYLQALQQASGAFAHRKATVSYPLMTTTQAMIALARKPFPFGLSNDLNRRFRPHFNSFTPSGKPTFKTRTVYVKATYADNKGGTGIKKSAIKITVDGKGKTKAATITTSSLALKLTGLTNGTHTVIVRIADKAGNSVSGTRKFTVKVPVAAPTPTPTPTYHPPTSPGNTYPPSSSTGSGSTGSGSGSSTPPTVLTPTPGATATPGTSSSPGTVTGTPLGPSPAASPGAPLTASGQPVPSPSTSVTGQVTTNGEGGGPGTAGWIGVGLVALLPLGALASFVVHRRQESALEGAGHGQALLGGGTPWERFKARVFGISNVVTLKR